MPIPQVTERIKEAPAIVLRTLFAGIGQLLLAADKLRGRALEQLAQPGQAARPAPPEQGQPAPPEQGRPTPAPPAKEQPATATTPVPGAPPIPGYDDLSIASLRARLRVQDATALRSLLDYEKTHARRDTVIAMFERRLAKITGEAG